MRSFTLERASQPRIDISFRNGTPNSRRAEAGAA
jgi:hypothetical protein